MAARVKVYVEVAPKRAFACAVDWPGWCRAGRNADEAIGALIAYGPRYKKAIGRAAAFSTPVDRAAVEVVHRLKGNASTEYGIPAMTSPSDMQAIDSSDLKRLTAILQAAWAAFDRSAEAAAGVELRKGPRGGGRDLDTMVAHVSEAEEAYLGALGARPPRGPGVGIEELRARFVETLEARATGKPISEPRNTKKPWAPRYAVRRSAWHSLDHAWEIEDRSQG